MAYTVSVHNGTKIAIEHNRRNEKIVSKEPHINPDGEHENWIDENIRQAYKRIFGEAQQEYNERQRRADRKIKNYFEQIKQDKNKHVAYEAIISIGNLQNIPDEKTVKDILKQYVEDWSRRNPNLELIGAYWHADEEGVAHIHCDYIPVAHNCTRGMKTQNALVKALEEMGFKTQNIHNTAQIQWQNRERETLGELCRERGWEVEKPTEEKRKHMETAEYKAQQALSSTIDHTNDLDNRIAKQERKLARKEKTLKLKPGEIERIKEDLNETQERLERIERKARESAERADQAEKELYRQKVLSNQLLAQRDTVILNAMEIEDAFREAVRKPRIHDMEKVLGSPGEKTVSALIMPKGGKAIVEGIKGIGKAASRAINTSIDEQER